MRELHRIGVQVGSALALVFGFISIWAWLQAAPAGMITNTASVTADRTDGSIPFDQPFPIQWATVGGAGGIGGAGCIPTAGVINPLTCPSYNIASTFAPWYRPGGTSGTLLGLITPGDNSTGGLNTTGSDTSNTGNLQVSANGVGDLLIFPYWTTQKRDTQITIVNAFGGQAQRFVHVRLRQGVATADVLDFTICLSPGDVWTAVISAVNKTLSELTVENPGNCDSTVIGAGFTPPPVVGVPIFVAATFGYIEAYTMEVVVGGGDDVIRGVTTLARGKFSASYNAIAFVNFNGVSESDTVAGNAAISQALAREGGVDKEILFTEYVAGSAITQVVLTFPAGNQPGEEEPVSAFFFDEDENVNLSPRSIFLPWAVNVCTIAEVDGVTNISCPGDGNNFDVVGATGAFTRGWVRILNNTVGAESEDIDTPPVTRFPVTGLTLR